MEMVIESKKQRCRAILWGQCGVWFTLYTIIYIVALWFCRRSALIGRYWFRDITIYIAASPCTVDVVCNCLVSMFCSRAFCAYMANVRMIIFRRHGIFLLPSRKNRLGIISACLYLTFKQFRLLGRFYSRQSCALTAPFQP